MTAQQDQPAPIQRGLSVRTVQHTPAVLAFLADHGPAAANTIMRHGLDDQLSKAAVANLCDKLAEEGALIARMVETGRGPVRAYWHPDSPDRPYERAWFRGMTDEQVEDRLCEVLLGRAWRTVDDAMGLLSGGMRRSVDRDRLAAMLDDLTDRGVLDRSALIRGEHREPVYRALPMLACEGVGS